MKGSRMKRDFSHIPALKPAHAFLGAVLGAILGAAPAMAALQPGRQAPDFTAQAAVGGKDFSFHLADALKKGPVVVYFYPKSFTHGCTIEAHLFAEASERIASLGGSLIGISADPIATQREFSSRECRDKFPVAADPGLSVIKSYDALRSSPTAVGETVADRISYVIAPSGTILSTIVDRKPDPHVDNSLAVLTKWHDDHPATER